MIVYLMDSSSLSVANEMCKTCINMDASNIKTLEIYSELYESHNAKISIELLQKAYKFTEGGVPWIGVKLAKLLYKSNNFVGCLDICNSILLKYPE